MTIVDLRTAVFRRAAIWLFAGAGALGCGSSSKTSYGNDANLGDSMDAGGANIDALDAASDAGDGAAAGAPGGPDASDAATDAPPMSTGGTTGQDAATDAAVDVAPGVDSAADLGGAAGAPALPACVLGSSRVGGCALQ